ERQSKLGRISKQQTRREVVAKLVSEFDSPADRELALQQFRAVRLAPDGDPSVLATNLTSLLRRGLPSLDDDECHQLAHTGVARTTDLLRQSAYWPGMQEDVMRYVLACPQCQLMKGDKCIRTSLQPIPVTTVGDLWSVDVMGPFPQTSSGNQYVLVMTEHATRWVEAVAIPDQRGKTVTEA
ncbi:Gypsy retrotransposon integrase-like protein, partial [Schistosoma japonicum]